MTLAVRFVAALALTTALPLASCGTTRVVPYEPPELVNPDAACAPAPPEGTPQPAVAVPAPGGPVEPRPPVEVALPDDFAGTVGATSVDRPNVRASALSGIRSGGHQGFDRLVFDFAGPEVPGYHVEYVDQPQYRCGTREPVRVAGDGALLVRVSPSEIRVDAGEAGLLACQRDLSLTLLREIELVCNRDGQVAVLVGMRSPNPYRVVELKEPSRLVIDVRQQR